MNVLVTGGAGYIGSHAAMRLLEDGHAVTIVDDLSRGHVAVIRILKPLGDLRFVQDEIGNRGMLRDIMTQRSIDTVMHFGAMAYVGESVEQPMRYYRRNAMSSLALLEAMEDAGVTRMIFSSTCATYGVPTRRRIPIKENCPQQPINPYGRSKLIVEWMLRDYAAMKEQRGEDFAFTALRYFNVAGADEQGRLGEDHRPETHLVPICLEVAIGQRDSITIYGEDYETEDGTCVRDYVHVEDLIDAHVRAMEQLEPGRQSAFNVGIGQGYSVREVIEAARRVTGRDIPENAGERRAGDPPVLFNDPTRIERDLGWKAQQTDLEAIIASAWCWKQANPRGYDD